jgi:putative DNA primase/helicase
MIENRGQRRRAQASSLVQTAGNPAKYITDVLRGSWNGTTGMVRCISGYHEDKTASLQIGFSGGHLWYKCYAGCSAQAITQALRRRGLSNLLPGVLPRREPQQLIVDAASDTAKNERNLAFARRIWDESEDAYDTVVDTYLAWRGLDKIAIPKTIRFHPKLKHPTGLYFPAMVALVTNPVTGEKMGSIHRTFLRHSGYGKAGIEPAKMSLGPIMGGLIELSKFDDEMLIGEGIETVLSVMQSTGMAGIACIAAPNMKDIKLPSWVKKVVILADNDKTGVHAAVCLGRRLMREGREVKIANSPVGNDFNDALREDVE